MTTRIDSSFREAVLDAAGRMQGKLIRYTSRFFGGDEEAARDVVQHAFLQLCRTKAGKRPEKIDPWLYRVCRNRAIDSQRNRKRQQSSSQQMLYQQTDTCSSSLEQLSDRELGRMIRQRLSLLPEAQGEAIDLWSFGMPYSEIASIMNRPESSIRVLVYRGLSKLRTDPALQDWLSDGAAAGPADPKQISNAI